VFAIDIDTEISWGPRYVITCPGCGSTRGWRLCAAAAGDSR
jgi:hypothetical protein